MTEESFTDLLRAFADGELEADPAHSGPSDRTLARRKAQEARTRAFCKGPGQKRRSRPVTTTFNVDFTFTRLDPAARKG